MRAGLANSIRFDPADPNASLGTLPQAPAVFALCAADPAAEPYLSKTPNLRRRLQRFLRGAQTSEQPRTRRLQLAHLWTTLSTPSPGRNSSLPCACMKLPCAPSVHGRKSGCGFALR